MTDGDERRLGLQMGIWTVGPFSAGEISQVNNFFTARLGTPFFSHTRLLVRCGLRILENCKTRPTTLDQEIWTSGVEHRPTAASHRCRPHHAARQKQSTPTTPQTVILCRQKYQTTATLENGRFEQVQIGFPARNSTRPSIANDATRVHARLNTIDFKI